MMGFVFHEKYLIFNKINVLSPPRFTPFYFTKQTDHHIGNFNLAKVTFLQTGYSKGLLKYAFVV